MLRVSSAWLVIPMILFANSILAQGYTPPSRLVHWGGPDDGPGEFTDPVAITVAPDGTLFVTDSAPARVQRFTSGGEFLLQIGPSGTKNILDHPITSVTDHHGLLYVAYPKRVPYYAVHRYGQSGNYGGAIEPDGPTRASRAIAPPFLNCHGDLYNESIFKIR